MNAVIDSRFERVEKALATLINSISTYNPSPALANDLVAADAELSQGLEQLSTHQSNYNKIATLRNTSANLDAQIRETLTLLTTTRSALISTPSTRFPSNTNPVSYSELLSYARRISKFTLPPTFREPEPQTSTDNAEGSTPAGATPKNSKYETQTNGSSTPTAATNGLDKDTAFAMDIDSDPIPATATQPSQPSLSSNVLPASFTTYLNPLSETAFFPWPTEEYLRRGALASIQILMDQGVDPATFDPEKSAELEAERKRVVEAEDQARDDERARMEEERRRQMERQMSVSGNLPGERVQAPPKQFELETFDDDDED